MTIYISLTELCVFSFLSLIFKVNKIFSVFFLWRTKDFQCQMHSVLLLSLFLCSRNTHILRLWVNPSSIKRVSASWYQPPHFPAPALRLSRLQHCHQVTPVWDTVHSCWTSAQESVLWLRFNSESSHWPLVTVFGTSMEPPTDLDTRVEIFK